MVFEVRLALPPYAPDFVTNLVELGSTVFGQIDPDYVCWRLRNMPEISTFIAEVDNEPVAFKIGYATTRLRYYSWLGGAHPSHRRNGLASALMVKQHQWVVEQGYTCIETAANEENNAMATLNLKHGFTVCGSRTDPERTQVLYLKDLVHLT